MIEKLKLHNETELWLEPDVATQTVDVFLYDIYNETKTRLVTWQGNKGIPGGNWVSNHFGHKDKFFNNGLYDLLFYNKKNEFLIELYDNDIKLPPDTLLRASTNNIEIFKY